MQTPKFKITPEILNLIAQIDEFKGQWMALQHLAPDRLDSLRHVATIESIGSSTRIEGVKLTDTQVEQLLQGLDVRHFDSRDEEEVAGYARAMDIVFDSYRDIPLTENHIKQLHKELLKYATKDKRHRGEYKKLSNNVEAFDADGKSMGVIFEASTPFETPEQMTELVAWTQETLDKKELHPLLVIALFVVKFLAIHPFQDGNGRLSRILTTLLLLQNGYGYVPYSSLERVVEENKQAYYLALRKTQTNLKNAKALDGAWIVFFLQCMTQQYKALSKKLEQAKELKQLPELAEQILLIAKDHGRVTVRDAEQLTKANRNTIKVHIKTLVSEGYLIANGQGKGTWYSLS